MRNLLFKITFCLLLGSLLIGNVSGQEINCVSQVIGSPEEECVRTILTAVPFLRIVPDARSGAMGDVGIGLSPDPNAMHFNASKLAFAPEDLGISVTYTPWLRALGLNDVYMAYLTAYKRIDKLQSIGFGLRYFSLGSIQFTDENGEPIATGRPNEFEIALQITAG